jgi:hypothetical protein
LIFSEYIFADVLGKTEGETVMVFFLALFLLIWLAFFSQYNLGNFLIYSHLASWLILIVTDEVGVIRGLAAIWLVFSAFVFIAVLFNYFLHKSVQGFLK